MPGLTLDEIYNLEPEDEDYFYFWQLNPYRFEDGEFNWILTPEGENFL